MRVTVFAVSDAYGETAERVVREAAGQNSAIVHTLVSNENELRRRMLTECRRHGVDSLSSWRPDRGRSRRWTSLSDLTTASTPMG